MILAWFDTKKSKALAEALADYYINAIPVDNQINDKKFEQKTQKVLNAMARLIKDFKRDNTLNVFQRAQLSSVFRWKLTQAGYSDAYLKQMTVWLIRNL